jgi:hypothetical protein
LMESVTNGVPSSSTSYSLTYPDGAVLSACSYTSTYTLGGSPDAGAEQ